MKISLFFFGADSDQADSDQADSDQTDSDRADSGQGGKYRLLFDAVRFADRHGLHAAWVPERHFLRFGGLYGNPSVTAAAIAAITQRLQIRAGSVVMPLHHPLEVAEAWSMIDHFCNGRAGIAIASGWHVNDFVLAPERYAGRREIMLDSIDLVQRLWRGEAVPFPNGQGVATPVSILPRPLRPDIPVWMTTSSEEGCEVAGRRGFGLLTSNFSNNYSLDVLSRKIGRYREHAPAGAQVSLMMHAYVGAGPDDIAEHATPAMMAYLHSNIEMQSSQDAGRGTERGYAGLEGRREQKFLQLRTRANINSELSFIGTIEDCVRRARGLEQAGVDEIACLIDFGIAYEQTMDSLRRLADIAERVG